MKKLLSLALALTLALAGVASAQITGGNVYGIVTDQQGAIMPGVSVTVVGETGTRATATGPDGAFRFLGLGPGDYTLNVRLVGLRHGRPQDPRHHRRERRARRSA